jgi:hypothetical protein
LQEHAQLVCVRKHVLVAFGQRRTWTDVPIERVGERVRRGLCSIGPKTLIPVRPPGTSTRRISPSAVGRSGKNCRPNWQSATSNAASGNGSASTLPSCHSIDAAPKSAGSERATATIPGLISTSSTRAPGRMFVRSTRSADQMAVIAGTR